MKNLWLLPTDKPSRFSLNSSGKYHLTNQLHTNSPNFTNQNIYITNDEEIKEGWYFNSSMAVNKQVFVKEEDIKVLKSIYGDMPIHLKKIILTDNQDLIKDGVQAIDNEFLEWFVENPSCEYVEIEEKYRKCCRNTDGKNENCIEPINCEGWLSKEYERPYKTTCDKRFEGYKIIIPQEEPKQETLEDLTNQIQNVLRIEFENLIKDKTKSNVEFLLESNNASYIKWLEAKWQQKKLCESEVIQRIRDSKSDAEARRIIRTL